MALMMPCATVPEDAFLPSTQIGLSPLSERLARDRVEALGIGAVEIRDHLAYVQLFFRRVNELHFDGVVRLVDGGGVLRDKAADPPADQHHADDHDRERHNDRKPSSIALHLEILFLA